MPSLVIGHAQHCRRHVAEASVVVLPGEISLIRGFVWEVSRIGEASFDRCDASDAHISGLLVVLPAGSSSRLGVGKDCHGKPARDTRGHAEAGSAVAHRSSAVS
jgi:hypothetical protein